MADENIKKEDELFYDLISHNENKSVIEDIKLDIISSVKRSQNTIDDADGVATGIDYLEDSDSDAKVANIKKLDIEEVHTEDIDIENINIEDTDVENANKEGIDIFDEDSENENIDDINMEDIRYEDIDNVDIDNVDIDNIDIDNIDIDNIDRDIDVNNIAANISINEIDNENSNIEKRDIENNDTSKSDSDDAILDGAFIKDKLISIFSSETAKKIACYGLFFIFIEAIYIFVANHEIDMKSVQVTMGIATVLLLFAYSLKREYFDRLSKKLGIDSFLFIIIIMGCIMRIGYCMYNNIYARAHDMHNLEDLGFGSKGSYLSYLIVEHTLPQASTYQLYHPPFSYIASAFSCFLAHPFLKAKDDLFVFGSAGKVSNCFASCVSLMILPALCKEFKLNEKAERIAVMLFAFCPGMYIVSGCLNEDAFCCFFTLLEILFTLRWEKKPNIKNTVILAILFGLGLQTSMLCVLPAIYTTFVFLRTLIIRKNKISYIYRYLIFSMIAFPLGLWHYVRNLLKFNLPFNYIYEQSVGGPLWTGNRSIYLRFFYLDISFLKDSPYWHIERSFNLPINFLKTELFDEYNYGVNDVFPYIILYVDLLLTLFVTFFGIYYLRRLLKEKNNRVLLFSSFVIGAFACYSYATQPFTCTLVARYYLALVALKGMVLGLMVSKKYIGDKVSVIAYNMTMLMLLLYSGASISMFCMI